MTTCATCGKEASDATAVSSWIVTNHGKLPSSWSCGPKCLIRLGLALYEDFLTRDDVPIMKNEAPPQPT